MQIKRTPQLILFLGVLAAAGVFLATQASAADDKDRNSKSRREDRGPRDKSAQPQPDDEALRRYDRNANGRLDPDEDAAMKADQEKAKRKKKG
jgi:hypothetical protein